VQRIVDIEICPVRLPRREQIALRYGSFSTLDNVMVRIGTDRGVTGYGEAAPIPPTFGETQATIVEALRSHLAPRLIGRDALNLGACVAEFDALPGHPCAKAALDIALHDVKGQALGVPVSSLLGGARRERVPVAWTLGIDDTEKVAAKALAAAGEGFPCLKLKGGRDPDQDLRLLRAVREALGERGPALRLDLNQGYANGGELLRRLPALAGLGIDLIEEPFPARRWRDYRELARRCPVPVCLDESLVGDADAAELARSGPGFVANLKVQKQGGLYRASRLLGAMETLGVPVVVGAHRDAWISNTAGVHLAATLGSLDYACDVRYAWSLCAEAGIAHGGPQLEHGAVSVPQAPGLGLRVDWDRVKAHAEAAYAVR
jgi:L-alanine-DL-glutamate epimerase-like enolase superfamily enzyme